MSNEGEMVASGSVGGSFILRKSDSRWDAYESRASAISTPGQHGCMCL
jgi:hypothetical protein